MANKKPKLTTDRNINKSVDTANGLIDILNVSLYGQSENNNINDLNNKFNNIMQGEIRQLNKNDGEDMTSFLGQLYKMDKKSNSIDQLLKKQFNNLNVSDDEATISNFISEAYRNRLLKQSDIHEISSQLIELREAINTMRDAVVSADTVEGRINHIINFKDQPDKDIEDYKPIVEHIEKTFDLQEKIKSFIVPKALEYGEYYTIILPYKKIFSDFIDSKMDTKSMYSESANNFNDSTISLNDGKDFNSFCESVFNDIQPYLTEEDFKASSPKDSGVGNLKTYKTEFNKDLAHILGNIEVCNDPIPIPILEEGFESVKEYRDLYVNESGDTYVSEAFAKGKNLADSKSLFNRVHHDSSDGVYTQSSSKKHKNEFDSIRDCFIRLSDPTKMLPVQLMDETIGYYYIMEDDVTPVAGILSSSLYTDRFNTNRREENVIANIASRIIEKFDKKFLTKNAKFKKLIVNAIDYYNLNEKRIRFQFIPKEYVVAFKVNKDEYGNGVSMIEPSLFYAKLYLMLLLFKIMSIILYSNDQKVNYLRQSGLDKNLINKTQEIARQKQNRNIHLMDLFSYTTLINKIGNGTELYVPLGKGGERPIETEILQGQDIQINNELMELLRNSYILGTGVPSAIMNYLNEADFAKSIEVANSKMNGRVVNYQLDFNGPITEMYKKIMLWSTNIPEEVIERFEFRLSPPKSAVNTAKQNLINDFESTFTFLAGLFYSDNNNDEKITAKKMLFKRKVASKFLPMFNYDELENIVNEVNIESNKESLDPTNDSGDDTDINDSDFQ